MTALAITDLWAFVIAVIVFLAIPGPGTFALLTGTSKGGVRGGYATLAGLVLGDQVLMWLAVAGVAALLKAHPAVFHAVQYAGAAYLVWIGIGLLRAKEGAGTGFIPMQPGHWFRQGFLITVLNPKAIVFYMAFFPLFIDPARDPGLATFAVMALLIAFITLLYCTGIIFIGDALARRLRDNSRFGNWMQRAAGVFLIGFGIRLGTQ
jgi:threonine/homoserine/homoserine lactone efflux protein